MRHSHPTKPVYLKACGIVTPVGSTTEKTAAAVRAGISVYKESSILNKEFRPMTMALIPEDVIPPLNSLVADEAPELTPRQSRMVRLAQLAIDDLSTKHSSLEGIPLVLSSSETLPDVPISCHPNLINQIKKQTGIEFHNELSMLIAEGKAGSIKALQTAMSYVESGLSDYVIVGGIDSFIDLLLLNTLDSEERILAEGVMDGFAPGEGAGFILISSQPETFQESGKQILIYPPGLSSENGHRYSEEPYKGDGLAQAFSSALSSSNLPMIETLFASLNGENFGVKELGVATTRNSNRLAAEFTLMHPADSFGDIGAAFFPVSIGLIAMGFANNYIKSPVLNYASSETKYRGAACIAKNN